MTTWLEGIDFTGDHSAQAAAIKRVGKAYVARYFTPDGGGLALHEAHAYAGAGLSQLPPFFEWEAERAKRGGRIGAPDAREALAHAERIGMPSDLPPAVYTVDFDARGPEIHGYALGWRNVAGLRRSVAYGGYRAIKYLFDNHLISHAVQTRGWSYIDGRWRWDPRALCQQYEVDRTVAGISCDLERCSSDFPLWRPRGGTGDVVRTLVAGMRGDDVKALVEAGMWLGYLPWPVLGRPLSYWGGWVNSFVAKFQADHHYTEKIGDRLAYGRVGRAKMLGTLAARKRAGWKPRRTAPLAPAA